MRALGAAFAAAALLAAAASAAAPSRWIDYFDATVGRTCVQSLTVNAGTETVVASGSQRVVSVTHAGGGARILDSVTTTVRASPPTGTTPGPLRQTVAYTFARDGVAFSPSGFSFDGYSYSYDGSERYPSLSALRAGRSITGTVTLGLRGATPTTAAALEKLLAPGHDTLNVAVQYRTGPAPERNSIATPAGTFRDPIGVSFRVAGARVQDANESAKVNLPALLGQLASAISANTYFTAGVGPVSTTTRGQTWLLAGCSG